ncbi:MAG: 4Fe-4S binding protein [Bacteroidales bacterium]|nr:4Fe-4S binding protein [Bacteroidales bacterium]MCF8338786.1 4Fe-4S binding protein [Bacteroidales bacterium]
MLALFFRNPAVSEYEVFGSIFQFTGSVWLFVLLALVIIASLLIKKPWCNFFCPINPIFGFLSVFRKKMRSLWKTG